MNTVLTGALGGERVKELEANFSSWFCGNLPHHESHL